eukprot:403375467
MNKLPSHFINKNIFSLYSLSRASFSTSSHQMQTQQGKINQLHYLFQEMIQTSSQIKDYNFRNYFVRRSNEEYEKVKDLEKTISEEELNKQLELNHEKLEQLKRIKIVQNMYFSTSSVIEDDHHESTK